MDGKMKKFAIIIIIPLIIILTPLDATKLNSFYEIDGNILYVGGDGPNNYTSIQAAINDAEDGDIIFVYSGRYYEDIYIWKNISLIGENRNTTIIELGRGVLIYGENLAMLKIKEFTIVDGATVPDGAITLVGSRNITIEDCYFFNNFWACILTYNTTNIKISNCTFDTNLIGIEIDYSCNIAIYRCDFLRDVVGMYAYFSSFNRLLECNFNHDSDAGIYLKNSVFSFVYHCNFIHTKLPAYFTNSFFNIWNKNYWNRPRILPKIIRGEIVTNNKNIPWFNLDWHPLRSPYTQTLLNPRLTKSANE